MINYKMSSDELFEILPSHIRYNKNLYSFNLRKSVLSNKIIVEYKNNNDEKLGKISRVGRSLNEALLNMVNWLYITDYYDIKSVHRKLKIKKILE